MKTKTIYQPRVLSTLYAVKRQIDAMRSDIQLWQLSGHRHTAQLIAQLDDRVRFIEARLEVIETEFTENEVQDDAING